MVSTRSSTLRSESGRGRGSQSALASQSRTIRRRSNSPVNRGRSNGGQAPTTHGRSVQTAASDRARGRGGLRGVRGGRARGRGGPAGARGRRAEASDLADAEHSDQQRRSADQGYQPTEQREQCQPTSSPTVHRPSTTALNDPDSTRSVSQLCSDYSTEAIPGVKAIEWNHFGFLTSDSYDVPCAFVGKRVCRECLTSKAFLTSCTKLITKSVTNAKYHLQIEHGIVYDDGKQKISPNEFNYSLVIKCCLDYSSFKSVENIGFVGLIRTIRPDLKAPTANTLVQNVLPKVHLLFRDHIKEYIKDHFTFGCLTSDIWTDNFFARSYICFNLFFLNKNLELTHVLLDAIEFEPPHSNSRIRSIARTILLEYEVDEDKLKYVTDNGANLVAAFPDRWSCIAHNIDLLTMTDCIPNQSTNRNPQNGNCKHFCNFKNLFQFF